MKRICLPVKNAEGEEEPHVNLFSLGIGNLPEPKESKPNRKKVWKKRKSRLRDTKTSRRRNRRYGSHRGGKKRRK
tara:strand:+ start:333 stop:557 length:225 start_codon:yes stop_codon:yes gene_type:complete